MSKLKYCSNNIFSNGSISITGAWAEDTDYPISNLHNNRVSKRGGFITAKTGEIVLSLGSAPDVNFISLMNHNLTSTATVTIEMNTSDTWGSPAFSQAVTYRAKDMHVIFSVKNYQYVRVVIDDSGRSSNDIKIGELIAGEYIELDRNYDWLMRRSKVHNRIQHETFGGSVWSQELFSRNTFSLSWSKLNSTQHLDVISMIEATNSGSKPMLVIIDDIPYYVRIGNSYQIEQIIEKSDLEYLGSTFFPVDTAIMNITLTEESTGIVN